MTAVAGNTLNAHYTDATLVQAMWAGLRDLGLDKRMRDGHLLRDVPGSRDAAVVNVLADATSIKR